MHMHVNSHKVRLPTSALEERTSLLRGCLLEKEALRPNSSVSPVVSPHIANPREEGVDLRPRRSRLRKRSAIHSAKTQAFAKCERNAMVQDRGEASREPAHRPELRTEGRLASSGSRLLHA